MLSLYWIEYEVTNNKSKTLTSVIENPKCIISYFTVVSSSTLIISNWYFAGRKNQNIKQENTNDGRGLINVISISKWMQIATKMQVVRMGLWELEELTLW